MVSKKENPLVSLIANVAAPVIVLKQGSEYSPLGALLVALMFPLFYGIWSFYQEKRINPISVLGLLNTLFTGGFVLLHLEGIWFALKEALFPLLIGLYVLWSSYTDKPFMKLLLLDSGLLNSDLIETRLEEKELPLSKVNLLIKKTTFYFSLTFFVSAILNFVLAVFIFTEIPAGLSETERTIMLNDQVAEMTWMGYVVILIPSLVLLIAVMSYFFSQLGKMTDLKLEQLVNNA